MNAAGQWPWAGAGEGAAATAPSVRGFWVEDAGRRYWVEVDRQRTLLAASVEVHAHDRRTTLRRLVNAVTLARLQAVVRPLVRRCAHCGATVKEAQ